MKPSRIPRREFLALSGSATAGLVLPISWGQVRTSEKPLGDQPFFQPNAILRLDHDNQFHLYLGWAEMGQGIYSDMALLAAEELRLEPEQIKVHLADADPAFNHPMFRVQVTGYSTSMKMSFLPVRQAAANMAHSILRAAENTWGAQGSAPVLEKGFVIQGDQRAACADFISAAASGPAITDAPLTPPENFRLIGQEFPRLDAAAKVNGSAEFGLDVHIPNMLRAAVRRPPVHGAKALSFDADAALALPGVHRVVDIFSGVAVLADSHWHAQRAAAALQVTWSEPSLSSQSSRQFEDDLKRALDEGAGSIFFQTGSGPELVDSAQRSHEAHYTLPYLAHATMEPMNCTAWFREGHCEIWVPTQAPGLVRSLAAKLCGIEESSVTVHTTFLGGAFGRRGYQDFAAEAVAITLQTGRAVQVAWTREDDLRHDYYRPASQVRLHASWSPDGRLERWHADRSGPDVMADGRAITQGAGMLGMGTQFEYEKDPSSAEGLIPEYAVALQRVRLAHLDSGLPIGFWRSVGHSSNAFCKESFIDELAHLTQQDPLAFRLRHLAPEAGLARVLRAVAKMARWQDQKPGGGRALGVAAHESFGSAVAQIAEVEVKGTQLRVTRVWCAVDCGLAVNLDSVRAQMESGIIFGLSAALHGEITLQDGAVAQSNFHDYPVLRITECPEIHVDVATGGEMPSGVGEPGVPPIAPAVANAVFRACGQRLRRLPLQLSV